MTEIAFEHFDPEFELGNLDINGKPIKPRKKPGRKPNPPSPAQRKAQNRAAQRAFRERKRREMRDAETNIKKCISMRDQAIKEAKSLKKKVNELRYENNYLKGQILTLKISCMANRVNVPKFWDTGMRDKMGSDITTRSKTKHIPQSLEFFLNSKRVIVTMDSSTVMEDDNSFAASPSPAASTEVEELFNHLSPPQPTATTSTTSSYQQPHQQQQQQQSSLLDPLLASIHSPPSAAHDQHQSPLSGGIPAAFNFNELSSVLQSAAGSEMDPLLMEYLLQPDVINDFMSQMKDVPPELWLSQVPPELIALIPPEIKTYLTNQLPPQQAFLQQQPQQPQQIDPIAAATATSSPLTQQQQQPQGSEGRSPTPPPFQPEIPVEDDFWVDIKNTTLSPTMSNKVYVAGPISPLDAVNQMRTMRDQNDNRYLLTPTELQRRVPHDPRIDLIPGPTMRDYMIIFQDFYNANELFNFLIESAMFIGGELGNPDCWFVPPQFISKYWFLCPNHRPTRPDNSVEFAVFFAQKMINLLKRRKEMYIMRDQHADQFLDPHSGSHLRESVMEEDEDEDELMEEEESVYATKNDIHQSSLDLLVINTINKDVPRIISPNVFTV